MSEERYINKLERELASARHQILILKAKCAILGDTGDDVLPISPPASLSSAATPCAVTLDDLQKSRLARIHRNSEASELHRRPQQLPIATWTPEIATTRRPGQDSRTSAQRSSRIACAPHSAMTQQPSRAAWASKPTPTRNSARAARPPELATTRQPNKATRASIQPPSRGACAPESATTLQTSKAALAPTFATARNPARATRTSIRQPPRTAWASKLSITRQPFKAAQSSRLQSSTATWAPASATAPLHSRIALTSKLTMARQPAGVTRAPELTNSRFSQPRLRASWASGLPTTQPSLFSRRHVQPSYFTSRLTQHRAKEAFPEFNTMIPRPSMKWTTAKPRCSHAGRMPVLAKSSRSIQPESSASAWAIATRNVNSTTELRPQRLSDTERSSTSCHQPLRYLRSRRHSDRVSATVGNCTNNGMAMPQEEL